MATVHGIRPTVMYLEFADTCIRFAVGLACTVALIVIAPGPGLAGEDAESLEGRLASALDSPGDDRDGLQVLSRAEAEYDGFAVAERLPRTGAYLVEMRASVDGATLRYPVKLERGDDGGWSIVWTPSREYATALVDFVRDGAGPELPDQYLDDWAEIERLPALPVVVRDGTVTTPLGSVSTGDAPGIEPPKGLGKQIGRWVDSVVERDEGMAGIDLMVGEGEPWSDVTRVLFGAASAGTYRVHCVVQRKGANGLGVYSALAPVFAKGRTPEQSSSFIVALDELRDARLRVTVGGELLTSDSADCPDGVSLCPEGPGGLVEGLPGLVTANFDEGPPQVAHVLFAVAADLRYGDALRWAIRVPQALGIPAKRLYLGHIRPEDRAPNGGGS